MSIYCTIAASSKARCLNPVADLEYAGQLRCDSHPRSRSSSSPSPYCPNPPRLGIGRASVYRVLAAYGSLRQFCQAVGHGQTVYPVVNSLLGGIITSR